MDQHKTLAETGISATELANSTDAILKCSARRRKREASIYMMEEMYSTDEN